MAKDYDHIMEYSADWKKKTGMLEFTMTNDYLFRALMQKDEKTLKALVGSFLKVDPETLDTEITNPIALGETINDKEYHLDVKVLVDKKKKVNLEMQVIRHEGWIERTLVYACREFDDLNKGDDYKDVLGMWQISICCFDLFEDEPEFFSDFMLVNINNTHQIYSDKFRISNMNLQRIDLATEENKASGLTEWAKLFKAKSWEDLKMLAENNNVIEQAVSSVSQLTEDKRIRDEIWRREDNARIELTNKNAYARAIAKITQQQDVIKEQDAALKEKDGVIEEKNAVIEEKDATIEKMKSEIERLKKQVSEQ